MASDQPARGGSLSIRQAAFIGVASMVGAGIFSLLGAAGEVAGSAVWISFLLAGGVAVLQGYSFSKIGARYPSSGGLLEYVVRGYGNGHITGVIAWLVLAVNAIITAMVAVSFGSYAAAAIGAEDSAFATKAFAALLDRGDVGPERVRLAGGGQGPVGRRGRRHRHPVALRRCDPRERRLRAAGAVGLSAARRHRRRASR